MMYEVDLSRLQFPSDEDLIDEFVRIGVLEQVDTKSQFQLTIMRGAKVVKRWPMRNRAKADKHLADWEKDRDERSIYFKGCDGIIEQREVTGWRPV